MAEYIEYGNVMRYNNYVNDNAMKEGPLLYVISGLLFLISVASFLGLVAHLTGLWAHPLLQSFWQSFNVLSFYLPALFFVSSRALIRSNWLHAFGLLSFGILPLITLNGIFQILLGTPSNFNIWLTQRISQTYSLWILSAIFAVQLLFLLHPGFRHFLFRLSKLALESFRESERYPEEGLSELENPADQQNSISPQSVGSPELPRRGEDPFPGPSTSPSTGSVFPDGPSHSASHSRRRRAAQPTQHGQGPSLGPGPGQRQEEFQNPIQNPWGEQAQYNAPRNELPELRSFGDLGDLGDTDVADEGYKSLSETLDRPSQLASYDFETLKRQLTEQNPSERSELSEEEELFEFSHPFEASQKEEAEEPTRKETASNTEALHGGDPGLDVLSTDTNMPEDSDFSMLSDSAKNLQIPKVDPVQAAFDQANIERPSFFEDSKSLAKRLDSSESQAVSMALEPHEQYDEYLQAQRESQRQERIMMRIQESEGDLVNEEEADKLLQREQALGNWRETYSEQIALPDALDADSDVASDLNWDESSERALDDDDEDFDDEAFESETDEDFFDLQENLPQKQSSERIELDFPHEDIQEAKVQAEQKQAEQEQAEQKQNTETEPFAEEQNASEQQGAAISLKDWLANDPTAPMSTGIGTKSGQVPAQELAQEEQEKQAELEPKFSSEDVSWDEFTELDKEFSSEDPENPSEGILTFDSDEVGYGETRAAVPAETAQERNVGTLENTQENWQMPELQEARETQETQETQSFDLETALHTTTQDWPEESLEGDGLDDKISDADEMEGWGASEANEPENYQTGYEGDEAEYEDDLEVDELPEPEFGESANSPMERFSVAEATEAAVREREEREEERAQKMLAPRVRKTWNDYHILVKKLIAYDEELELRNTQIDAETEEAGESLLQTLKKFKIDAEMTHILRGPSITEFGILPAPGIKLNRVEQLADNLAMELAARSIRIVAPIPGKKAVGIEIPNRKRSTVSCLALLDSDTMREAQQEMELPIVLGKEINGSVQVADLRRMPHLLIAGATGSGKSVCVNVIISSLILSRTPLELRLMMIDPKIVELKQYNDIPHLLTPVITDASRAIQALQWISSEMERRYALLDAIGAGNKGIESYNRYIKEKNLATMPLEYIVVIIDEFADLMSLVGKELESMIARLAAMSRAVGIHLVLATQRPSVDVVTGLIKANFPTRIAFMVASQTDSRTILDMKGAEQLLGQGDMLFSLPGNALTRIQGAYLSEDDVEEITNYIKSLGKPAYLDEIIFEDEEREETHSLESGEDDLFPQAVEIAMQAGEISTSYLQRKLSIGYNRAARIIDEMEERSIIGPAQGSKKREVLAN